MPAPEAGPPFLHRALLRHTGFLISRVGMVAQKRFAERLETLGMTPRMWGALNVLDAEGGVTQLALCRGTGIDPSSMVSTIDELAAKGLVERRRNPTDRRAHALYVTAQGQAALKRGRELAAGAQDELLAPLNSEERTQLHGLLLRLATGAAGGHGSGEELRSGGAPRDGEAPRDDEARRPGGGEAPRGGGERAEALKTKASAKG